MKYRYILPTLAAIGMMASSCSNDELLTSALGQKGQEVTVSAVAGGQTRLAITEAASGVVNFAWENSDQLYMVNPTNAEITPFALKDGAGKSHGYFAGTPNQPYTSGQNLVAVYSKNSAAPVVINQERNGVYLDLSGQDGSLSDKYQYMFGNGIYQADGTVDVQLQNLVSVIKATLHLPQEETAVNQIVFKDKDNNYYSNAYLMLQNGMFGEQEYHAGDLIRKGEEYAYNGEWNERTDVADASDSSITLNGNFAVQDGSITKYFYVMKVRHTHVVRNHEGSGTDHYNFNDMWGMNPSILLIGEDKVYLAQTRFGESIEPGNIYDLELDAQALPTIALDTPTDVVSEDSGNKQYYAFHAETAGFYSIKCPDTGISLPFVEGYPGFYRSLDVELQAGEWLIVEFSNNSTATIKKVEPLEVGKEYSVEAGDKYSFTPTETGVYKLDGAMTDYFSVSCPEGFNGHMAENIYFFRAGASYFIDFEEATNFTFVKLQTTSLTLGNNTCVTSGYNESDGKTYYTFEAPSSDIYKLVVTGAGWYSAAGEYRGYTSGVGSEDSEHTIGFQANTPVVIWFPNDEVGKSINVAIEKLDYVNITPGVSQNLTTGQKALLTTNEGGAFYKIEGTATMGGMRNYCVAYEGDTKLLTCLNDGDITFSKIEKNPVAEYSAEEQMVLEEGKIYVLDVSDEFSGSVELNRSDPDAEVWLLEKEHGYYTVEYLSWLNPGKFYMLATKDVTISFSKPE